MSVYLKLFHGRTDRFADMEDMGTDGPTLGPFESVHITYLPDIKVKPVGAADVEWLAVVDDMIKHNGVFYGDWIIRSEP